MSKNIALSVPVFSLCVFMKEGIVTPYCISALLLNGIVCSGLG